MVDRSARPSLIHALRLRCLYCGQTPLRKERSWFEFGAGCSSCDYKYEREEGYYTGASWMVGFTVTSLVGMIVAALVFYLYPDADAMVIAAAASFSLLLFGMWFFPYSQALWMYFDHTVHPLDK